MKFKGCHYPKEIILMSIRWYIAYPLSYRHVEELLKERGMTVDHTTINRWVIKYSEALELIFKKQRQALNKSWKMDETYIKIKGKWFYYYRAVDKDNQTVDFYLSETRDTKATVAFFNKAISNSSVPNKVNIDKSGANLAALEQINQGISEGEKVIKIRQIKYLNNAIEQDHQAIKRLTRPMLGFKSFISAKATLAGIELYHMIRKGQNLLQQGLTAFEQFYALTVYSHPEKS